VQAVYAAAAEMAVVAERTSEPAAGEIRLKWWADVFGGIELGDARSSPVADAALDTLERFSLPQTAFEQMAAARRFDLYQEPMPNLTQLEGYAGETSSVVYQMAALIVNGGKDPGAADAAGYLGVAEALTRAIAEMPRDLSRGRVRVPLRVFAATGVTAADLVSGKLSPGVVAATEQLRSVARGYVERTRAALKEVPKSVRPVFAPIVLVERTLTHLDKGGDNPFQPVQPLADWRKLAAIVGFALRS
jgi:phytoene synthase